MPEEIEEIEDGVEQEAPESNVIDASDKFTNGNNDDVTHGLRWYSRSVVMCKLLNSGYNKAKNRKEAFSRKLTDRDYYKNNTNEVKKKIDDNKKQKEENLEEIENNSNTIEENKEKVEKSSDKKEKKDIKNENNELKKENKTLGKENKKLDKSIKKGEKDLKSIKKDEKKAKRYALTHPVEAAKILVKKFIKRKLLINSIIIFLAIVLVCFIIEYIFEIFERIDKMIMGTANFHEKLDNFVNGLGFNNSEQAFYKEFKSLNEYYDNKLNNNLLMSTIFYNEIQNGMDPESDEVKYAVLENYDQNSIISYGVVVDYIRKVVDESNETVGEDGLKYTSNKIYRLRRLARKGMSYSDADKKEVSLKEYSETIGKQLGKNSLEILESGIKLKVAIEFPIIGVLNTAESLYQVYFNDEDFFMTDVGANIEKTKVNATELLRIIFSIFDADFSFCKSGICVKYSVGKFDEDAYFKYLKEEYIPKMPEFQKYLDGLSGSAYDNKIDDIIQNIKEIAEDYDEYFGDSKKEKSAEVYIQDYQGNISPAVIKKLRKPVDVPEKVKISFNGEYAYGTSNGLFHTGIDINEKTTGNKEGDNVYSIYSNGEVEASTTDNSFSDCEDCKGGWVKIRYNVDANDTVYDLSAIYGGLNPDSLTLKKGDKVDKDQVIGKIGSAEQSDEEKIASLHFAIYDNNAVVNNNSTPYLNPISLFISTDTLVGETNKEKIWNYLLAQGLSIPGAAGVMGNMAYEAVPSFDPTSVEGTSLKKSGYTRQRYVEEVDSGKITLGQYYVDSLSRFGIYSRIKDKNGNLLPETYVVDGQTYVGYRYGHGLCGFTAVGIKEYIIKYTMRKGRSIGDLQGQLEALFAYLEDNQYSMHNGILDYLKRTDITPEEAGARFSKDFERNQGGAKRRACGGRGMYEEMVNGVKFNVDSCPK